MGNVQAKKVKEKWSSEGVLKAKGLSKLQRAILCLAGTGPGDYRQLTTREIMIKLFDWMPARTPDYSGGQSFDVRMIGAREYRKRTVSVSRSIGRLCQRGLMERCFSSGHSLTRAGRDYVAGLNG